MTHRKKAKKRQKASIPPSHTWSLGGDFMCCRNLCLTSLPLFAVRRRCGLHVFLECSPEGRCVCKANPLGDCIDALLCGFKEPTGFSQADLCDQLAWCGVGFLLKEPGQALQREMKAFVEAGIPLEQVWHLATVKAGQRLKVDKLGELSAGAPADVLLFDRDPTLSLKHLSSLRAVIRAGRLYDMDALQEGLTHTLEVYRSPLIRMLARRGAQKALAGARG